MRLALRSAMAALPLALAPIGTVMAQELDSFAVIAGSTLTNTGPTIIDGNIALSPGTSYTGSTSVTQTGQTFIADAVAMRQQERLTTLYNALSARPTSQDGNLTGQDLGGKTLTAGVYNFDSSAGLAAGQVLTLDAGGDPNAVFIFNIGSTLTTGPGSSVVLANDAQGGNVFYRIGSSATLDTTSDLKGQIVALTSITMNTGAKLDCGAAYARNGAVTLDTNIIRICTLAAQSFDTVVADPTLTQNQNVLAGNLSDFVANGGVLPIEFAILAATQSPAELAVTLSQLSGEVSTGVAPMGLQSMDAFLDTVLRSGRTTQAQIITSQEPGVPVGMVQDRSDEAFTGKYGNGKYDAQTSTRGSLSDDGSISFAAVAPMQARHWDIWIAGYGASSDVDANTARGYHARTSDNRGLAAGLNFAANISTDLGVAVSWNEADFVLAEGFGSGTSDTVFLALRGKTASDHGYVEGAVAYGQSDITTQRTLTIAGIDRLVGETNATTLAGHVEAGYHMGIFTPFAGLRAKSITTDAYSETAAAGTSSYALHYDKQTTNSLRSELGVAMRWSEENPGEEMPAVEVRAAWAHELASNEVGQASFVSIPGLDIPVSGVSRDRDSLLLAASANWMGSNGIYLDAGLNAEYSRNAQDYGGSLTIGYRW